MPLSFEQLTPFLSRTNLTKLEGTDIFVNQESSDAKVFSQFDDGAETYSERYKNYGNRYALLDRAFSATDYSLPRYAAIFDMGAGAGNNVIPIAQRSPESSIIAADLAPRMLQILNRILLNDYPEHRHQVGLICTDVTLPLFNPGVFDLIIGDSILHHLLDPTLAVHQALYALKPGGLAIFMEPFELGAHFLSILYRQILEEARQRAGLPDILGTKLERKIIDTEARFGYPRIRHNTHRLDDKWIFNKNTFYDLADQHHCRRVLFQDGWAGPDIAYKFKHIFKNFLRHAGCDSLDLPTWVWDIVETFDQSIAPSLKLQAMVKGVVVFEK